MFLLKINKICNNIYDNSLHITENISTIIRKYNYSLKTDSQKSMFVSISVMFCFYFFECVLRHYYKYSDKKCFIIIDLLITELSSHLGGVTKEQTFNAYMEITNILGHAPQEDIETYTVINFLFMALQLNEDDEVENFLILDIYNEFNNILKNVYKLL